MTLAAWGAVPLGVFQFDDPSNVVEDPATASLGAFLPRLLSGVRPLTRLSCFLDHAVWGMRPAGFLLTNLALHLLCVLLVHALAEIRLGNPRGAFAAAAAFALQPAQAETVAYVSGRSMGLMAALLLAGLLAREQGRPRLALVAFGLACLAREVALVFPLLLLVWEVTRTEPRRVGRGPFLLALGVVGGLAALARYRSLAGFSLGIRSPWESLLANGRAVPEMVSLWVRPWALSVDHGFVPGGHRAMPLLGLSLIAVAGGWAFLRRRTAPAAALAVLWTLLCLAPTNSVIPKLDLVTEKPLYLAWVGPALLLGQAALWLTRRAPVRLAAAVTGLVFAAAGSWCVRRVALWREPVLLWSDALAKAPARSRCWDNLGMAWWEAGDPGRARLAFQGALELDPANEDASENLKALSWP